MLVNLVRNTHERWDHILKALKYGVNYFKSLVNWMQEVLKEYCQRYYLIKNAGGIILLRKAFIISFKINMRTLLQESS